MRLSGSQGPRGQGAGVRLGLEVRLGEGSQVQREDQNIFPFKEIETFHKDIRGVGLGK